MTKFSAAGDAPSFGARDERYPARTAANPPLLRLQNRALAAALTHPEFPVDGWQLLSFKAGESILQEGNQSGLLYAVQEGVASVEGTVKLHSGRNFQAGVTKLEPGAVFGEIAMFDQQPHSASVIAQTDATVVAIDGACLLAFLDHHKELGYEVFKDFLIQLAPRLRATNSRVYRFLAWGLKAYHLE